MKKTILLSALILFFFSCLPKDGRTDESLVIPCEVYEAQHNFSIPKSPATGLGYALLHQANAAQRQLFSEWLKKNSGKEISFSYKGRRYDALLFRLSYCFGRGLLFHASMIDIKKGDIIDLYLDK